MRPLARQSARLASASRVRQSSVPRSRASQQQRGLHASGQRLSDPRSPNGQPEHDATSASNWRDPLKRHDTQVPKRDEAAQQETDEAKGTNDSRKPSVRRTLRQKRSNDVPKPPPIPGWFLKHNVKLLEDSPGHAVSGSNDQVIRCVDTETGHTLFSVPYYEVCPKSPDAEKQDKRRGRDAHPQRQPSNANTSEKSDVESASQETKPSGHAKRGLHKDFFSHTYQIPKPSTTLHAAAAKQIPGTGDFVLPEKASQNDEKLDPMSWIYLEAELSARAALQSASETSRSASFAIDRVDLSLQCPDPKSHEQMDEFVRDLARIVQADVISLDSNDFAELADEYVGQGRDEPGSFSNLGYDVYRGFQAVSVSNSNQHRSDIEDDDEEGYDEEGDEDEDEPARGEWAGRGHFASVDDIKNAVQKGQLGRVLSIAIGSPSNARAVTGGQRFWKAASLSSPSNMNRDDARLSALLDSLLDAPQQKRTSERSLVDIADSQKRADRRKASLQEDVDNDFSKSYQRILRDRRANASYWLPQTARTLVSYLGKTIQGAKSGDSTLKLTAEPSLSTSNPASSTNERSRTIVQVRDLRDICEARLGESIIQILTRVVQKRRRSGEQIMIIGTTAQDVEGPFPMSEDQVDDFPLRTLTVPPFFNLLLSDKSDLESGLAPLSQKSLDEPAYQRILDINLRHMQSMLRRMRPDEEVDILSASARRQMNLPGMHFLTEKVLSIDQVQRLALLAIGLAQSHARADSIQPVHVALACFVMTRSDHATQAWKMFKERKRTKNLIEQFESNQLKDAVEGTTSEGRIERLKKICNQHEVRLLSGMVDAQNLKTGFADVHAPTETIEALKTLTTLSLLRPDAFKYGVLAADRLPGLLLYGPPGTGKTLLAKAVAKESQATVLEVSGAQIYEKYVGEGEKMVRAVFSLAKKLSPCVVFIDEADAIFGSRSNAGNRNTHREIINQFLREWDGMDDHGVFMMVATNRPFDLDDAVLRRLPRRLLIDLPVAKDRESILGIHLKNEILDSSVSLSTLAEQTPLYSGSDLKNLSVAAALACVREENELAEKHKDDKTFKLPEKRILTSQHFDKALTEISASISEDMTSLAAVRKFDEQYGDRKGRRKKTGYGFGAIDGAVDESAARVRHASSSPPPP